jgi:hypothetical protein
MRAIAHLALSSSRSGALGDTKKFLVSDATSLLDAIRNVVVCGYVESIPVRERVMREIVMIWKAKLSSKEVAVRSVA